MEFIMEVVASEGRTIQINTAVLVYGDGYGGNGYVSVHKVEVGKNGHPVILPGQAASRRGLTKLFRELVPSSRPKVELLHERVIAKGEGFMAWYQPSGIKRLYFNSEHVGRRSEDAVVPATIHVVTQGNWYVFAYKGKERPNAETPLFQSPFYNVWSDGRVCVGSMPLPKGTAASQPDAWEEAFFGSEFTHPNIHSKNGLVLYKGGAATFWKDAMDGKFKRFPEKVLVPLKDTLGSFFKKLAKEVC
jgi:PRTRC genetic system protein B